MIISIKDESSFEALKLEDVLPNAGGFRHVLADEVLLDIENGDCQVQAIPFYGDIPIYGDCPYK